MRLPKPWLRAQNQTWYVQISGEQVNLGKDKKKAFDEFHKLMHVGRPKGSTVRNVLDAYWKWSQKNLVKSSCDARAACLKAFGESLPKTLKASDLKPLHVQRWLDGNDRLKSPTTVSDRITLIKTVMNWACAMGYLDVNPIAKMPKPARRVREEFVPPDRWAELMGLATDQEFRDFLTFMLSSGCRPQEIVLFEAKHFDGSKFVLPLTKSKGKKRQRVIYLPPDALAIVQRLVKSNPEGVLFRNRKGRAWEKNSIRCRFRRLKTEMNLPWLTATNLRHSFAHYRLSSGQDALTVAKLMGHVDTRMVATRYGHLEDNQAYMQASANQISFPAVPSAPASQTS